MALEAKGTETRLPAQDLERARRWYSDKFGWSPTEERPGGLRYAIGDTAFCLFDSTGTARADFTQVAIAVDDIEAAVEELLSRGVVFERGDGGTGTARRSSEIIVEIDNNYASKGSGERGAFFRDSENNLLSLGQAVS